MGSILSRGEYGGLLGSREESFPHQCFGDAGSLLCPKGIHEGSGGSVNLDFVGQLECCCPHKQDGWHKIPGFDCSNKEIWTWCLERKLQLSARHIPGKLNLTADFLSRFLRDRTDWILNLDIFTALNKHWGPLQVDLFASRFQLSSRDFSVGRQIRMRKQQMHSVNLGLIYWGLHISPMVSGVTSSTQSPNEESNIGCDSPLGKHKHGFQ